MTNFGVELFLQDFLQYAQSPVARAALVEETAGAGAGVNTVAGLSTTATDPSQTNKEIDTSTTSSAVSRGGHSQSNSLQERLIAPEDPEFTGFVFKLQANLDPKHRDRMAFVRICSGVFRKGMKVQHSRMKRSINLTSAQSLFAQEREAVTEAYPGDVIGIHNPGIFAIGDTIYSGSRRVVYPGIPSFSPEKFAYIRNANPSAYKKFQKVKCILQMHYLAHMPAVIQYIA